MSLITYSVEPNMFKEGKGWFAYRYARPNDSSALDWIWKNIINEDVNWDIIEMNLQSIHIHLRGVKIKSKVDTSFPRTDYMDVCRPGKMLPSIWISKKPMIAARAYGQFIGVG